MDEEMLALMAGRLTVSRLESETKLDKALSGKLQNLIRRGMCGLERARNAEIALRRVQCIVSKAIGG